jgi:hypothetical protein
MDRQRHPACLDGIGIVPVLTFDPNEPPVSRFTRGGKMMAHSTKNFLIVILASTTAFLLYQFWLLTN